MALVMAMMMAIVLPHSLVQASWNITQTVQLSNKKANVLGMHFDYAVMDLILDREIYTYMSIPCPNTTYQPPAPNPIDCSCDYASKTKCGSTLSGNPTCPPCSDAAYLCNPSNTQWYNIEPNKTMIINTQNISKFHLRYNYNVNTTTPEGLMVTAELIGRTNPFQRVVMTASHSSDNYWIYCPSDIPKGIQRKTASLTLIVYVEVQDFVGNVAFTLHTSNIVPRVDNTAAKCQNVTKYHQCINDGQIVHLSGHDALYTFSVDRPMVLSIFCYLDWDQGEFSQGIQTVKDVEISISDQEKYPNATNHKWRFYSMDPEPYGEMESSFMGTLPVTPLSNGASRLLYINVVTVKNLSCTFTSYSKQWRTPVFTSDRVSSFMRAYNGAHLLYGDGTVQTSDDRSMGFQQRYGPYQNTYPVMNVPNPFIPIPMSIMNDPYLSQLYPSDDIKQVRVGMAPFKTKSFQATFQLSRQVNDYRVIYNDYGTVSNAAKMQFTGIFVDIDGNPFDNLIELSQTPEIPCSYTRLLSIQDLIKKYQLNMSSNNDNLQLIELRYNLDIISFMDEWQGCVNQTSNLMLLEPKNVTMTTNSCPGSFMMSGESLSDPCCNKFAKFSKCCQSREVTMNMDSLVGFHTDRLTSCSSPACTQSSLQDYYASTVRMNNGECTLSLNAYNQGQHGLVQLLQQCKTQAYVMPWCDNDTQCPSGGTCSFYTRKCVVPLAEQDRSYITCVLEHSSISSVFNLKTQLGLATSTALDTLVEAVYQSFRIPDCTSPVSNDYRTNYHYEDPTLSIPIKFMSDCPDRYCPLNHLTYIDYNPQLAPTKGMTSAENCVYNGICQGLSMLCTPDKFGSNCSSGKPVCLLPNGKYNTTIKTQEECSQLGVCTGECGLQCTGPSYCLASKLNQAQCNQTSMNFTNGACYVNVGQQACLQGNYTWFDCGALTPTQCNTPKYSSTCQVKPIACTKDQCTGTSGTCSDSLYFTNSITSKRNIGLCTKPHSVLIESRKQMVCAKDEYDSPMGCFNPLATYTTEDCHAFGNGYTWWEPAFNQSSCESKMGCLMSDFSNTTAGQSRFNEMTQDQCTQCQSSADMYQWTNKFNWIPGRWLPGVMVVPTWYSYVDFISTSSYGDSFSIDGFGTALSNIMKYDLIRSSCQFQGIQDSVETVSCSCSGPGGSPCFNSTSVPTQSLQVCSMESKNRETYSSAPSRVPLSAEFFSYKPPVKYGITNDEGAFVGTIQNNGISIQGPVKHFTLCQLISETTSEYPINDIAMTSINNVTLLPMDATPIIGLDYICINITQVDRINNDSITLFPIIRMTDWKTSKEFFTKSQTVMMYFLGTAYGLCALWGLFQISVIVVRLIRRIERPKLAHALITAIAGYTFIRSVYFFILPTGTLYSSSTT
ncbi:hypothetical protein SAMD00019534_093940 [Acytostelium subglobosum LB1]|uniref:hypothetical protein n=1 Tax=Acytostelium subglobosum LB1 TaxID=1410327 RepID=UPI000644EB6E|nr:hypothetical protein SAMD00019534_093940 [Acytostelium subglobosum LB1]GAM26219.1 hypothetical protein SAMD00019534_093940 [Acytostelium subglobosum LB1]|eukprot:XP_012750773.1 hypothetical protein SAMD00019534_093940 [Acytostelium subglobosum LB1]